VITAALGAAVVVSVGVALPPARLAPAAGAGDAAVPGALHVHTNRSDGRSSPDQIAAIAARAGLKFVVFADHGDATRIPDPPSYRSGVLCIDAVEISTSAGHLIALGLPAAPYPLAGEARDVLDDVHRLGGWGIAAHPDSPKVDLEWRDWSVPLDGLEMLNLDTAWRVHAGRPEWRSRFRLVTALLTYPIRPAETIASLLTDAPALAARWDELTAAREVPLFAGADAHARLELRDSRPGDNRFTLALPGYEAVFRTLTMRVRTPRPLSGDAAADAPLVLDALVHGRGYAVIDAIQTPPVFDFSAVVDGAELHEGQAAVAQGPVTLAVRTNAPPSFTTTIWRDGAALASRSATPELTVTAPAGAAVYRVDIRATDRPGAPVWILSNPIYIRKVEQDTAVAAAPPARPAPRDRALFDARASAEWRTESAPESKVALDVIAGASGREMRVRYALPGGDGFGQYAAVVVDTKGGLAPHARVVFTARAERPMRISVQLRSAVTPTENDRWQRSVYVDTADAVHSLALDDFMPVGATRTPRAPIETVHAILFAVDRTNTKPGSAGRFWLKNVSLR
jgi:hypothetical protein